MIKLINKILIFLKIKNKDRIFILHLISTRNLINKKKNLEGAEVGVYRGEYSLKILKYFEDKGFSIKLHLIDPWKIDSNFQEYGNENLEKAYTNVKLKFKNKDNVKIYREDSKNAVKYFKDLSLDFVYIDGNHDYNFVKNDLEMWFPKIKDGGIVFGDDYLRPYGVSKAVSEFSFKKNLIVNFSDNGNQYYFIKNST